MDAPINIGATAQAKTGSLGVSDMMADRFCFGSDCISSWSEAGGGSSQWTTSGSNIYYTDGNVGVGITNPSVKFNVSGEIASERTGVGNARYVSGDYGIIERNDGSNFYTLITNSGDQYGSWNSLRPFRINLASGDVVLANAAIYAQHGGNVGIGTSSPSFPFSVLGTIYTTGGVRFPDGTVQTTAAASGAGTGTVVGGGARDSSDGWIGTTYSCTAWGNATCVGSVLAADLVCPTGSTRRKTGGSSVTSGEYSTYSSWYICVQN